MGSVNFKTPTAITVGVVCALAGVAGAALALPSSPPATVAALNQAGHSVDDCDLYAEGFDPVLSRDERMNYHDAEICRKPVQTYVDRVLAGDH